MRKLVPAPGRLIVKFKPVSRGTGFMGLDGKEIEKADDTVEWDSFMQNICTVVAVGPTKKNGMEPFFQPGDEIVVTRSGASEIKFDDDGKVVRFWLLPFEAVQGVWLDTEEAELYYGVGSNTAH